MTVLHGGVFRQPTAPNKSGNKMKKSVANGWVATPTNLPTRIFCSISMNFVSDCRFTSVSSRLTWMHSLQALDWVW